MIELLSSIIAQYPFFAYNILFVFKKVHLKKKKKKIHLFSQAFTVQPGRVQPNWTKHLRSLVY